jgi:hypothetical protein
VVKPEEWVGCIGQSPSSLFLIKDKERTTKNILLKKPIQVIKDLKKSLGKNLYQYAEL